ncbi:14202_t:CDS:2, partial [Racocetra fulgida]
AHLYEAKGANWTCLDGSATIPYEAINDDFCDCADGSDEPECCDGSDEYDGKIKCPNICKEASAEYHKKLKEIENLRAQGIRIRNGYIEDGKKLRIQREAELNRLRTELEAAKIRVREREEMLWEIKDDVLELFGLQSYDKSNRSY